MEDGEDLQRWTGWPSFDFEYMDQIGEALFQDPCHVVCDLKIDGDQVCGESDQVDRSEDGELDIFA